VGGLVAHFFQGDVDHIRLKVDFNLTFLVNIFYIYIVIIFFSFNNVFLGVETLFKLLRFNTNYVSSRFKILAQSDI
jgi:hypothetical protein